MHNTFVFTWFINANVYVIFFEYLSLQPFHKTSCYYIIYTLIFVNKLILIRNMCSYSLKGNFAIFDMLTKYVPGGIKYIFTKFYRHISTNNEANRKFVILISNFSIRL